MGQLGISGFMEKPERGEHRQPCTLLQELFGRMDNPAVRCRNCLCNYCADNAEEVYHRVNPGEMRECCLNCDECREYMGDCGHAGRIKEDCGKFVVSGYGAGMIRKRFRIVKGWKDGQNKN